MLGVFKKKTVKESLIDGIIKAIKSYQSEYKKQSQNTKIKFVFSKWIESNKNKVKKDKKLDVENEIAIRLIEYYGIFLPYQFIEINEAGKTVVKIKKIYGDIADSVEEEIIKSIIFMVRHDSDDDLRGIPIDLLPKEKNGLTRRDFLIKLLQENDLMESLVLLNDKVIEHFFFYLKNKILNLFEIKNQYSNPVIANSLINLVTLNSLNDKYVVSGNDKKIIHNISIKYSDFFDPFKSKLTEINYYDYIRGINLSELIPMVQYQSYQDSLKENELKLNKVKNIAKLMDTVLVEYTNIFIKKPNENKKYNEYKEQSRHSIESNLNSIYNLSVENIKNLENKENSIGEFLEIKLEENKENTENQDELELAIRLLEYQYLFMISPPNDKISKMIVESMYSYPRYLNKKSDKFGYPIEYVPDKSGISRREIINKLLIKLDLFDSFFVYKLNEFKTKLSNNIRNFMDLITYNYLIKHSSSMKLPNDILSKYFNFVTIFTIINNPETFNPYSKIILINDDKEITGEFIEINEINKTLKNHGLNKNIIKVIYDYDIYLDGKLIKSIPKEYFEKANIYVNKRYQEKSNNKKYLQKYLKYKAKYLDLKNKLQ